MVLLSCCFMGRFPYPYFLNLRIKSVGKRGYSGRRGRRADVPREFRRSLTSTDILSPTSSLSWDSQRTAPAVCWDPVGMAAPATLASRVR